MVEEVKGGGVKQLKDFLVSAGVLDKVLEGKICGHTPANIKDDIMKDDDSHQVPCLSLRKAAALHQLVDRVEEEDAHGEEEEGGERSLVHGLGGVRPHRAVLRQVLLLKLAHQLGNARVGVLPHGLVHSGEDLPQIDICPTLGDVPDDDDDIGEYLGDLPGHSPERSQLRAGNLEEGVKV